MNMLLFEWFCGGGLLRDKRPAAVEQSLFREGFAMASALANDLLGAGHSVVTPIDHRLIQLVGARLGQPVQVDDPAELPQILQSLGRHACGIIVVAPESGGRLLQCHQWLTGFELRMLSPTGNIAKVGCCKQLSAELFEAAKVQIPFGTLLSSFSDSQFPFDKYPGPFIVKPLDGAGSEDIRYLANNALVTGLDCHKPQSFRIEKFLSGVSASVSVVGGPNGRWILPPTRQVFASGDCPEKNSNAAVDWPGAWIGFDYPLRDGFAERAISLVRSAVEVLPEFVGHIGLDLVLSDNRSDEDRIVDLNPRMTSSWAGLRQMYSENIGQRMIQFAQGQACSPEPRPARDEFQFRIADKPMLNHA